MYATGTYISTSYCISMKHVEIYMGKVSVISMLIHNSFTFKYIMFNLQ